MRANESGIVVGGLQVPKVQIAAEGRVVTGEATVELAGEQYQYVFVTRPANGFTVSVAQPYYEIFAPLTPGQNKQLIANSVMTLLVFGIVFWLIRSLTGQQRVLEALRLSERNNQQLIERLETEHARSSRAASIDHLSGLFNRRQFLDVADSLVLEQRRQRKLSTMLFIDLDRFKSINDSLGHHIGDLLLQAVAGRIQRMLDKGDIAARFGGDEFVVLLVGDRSEADIEQWAAALTAHLSAPPYMLEGTELNTSPSIGIAISPRDGQSIDELTKCADAAMYSAKKAGRGQYRFFDQSLNVSDVEEFHLEQAFVEALKNREFILHYQPPRFAWRLWKLLATRLWCDGNIRASAAVSRPIYSGGRENRLCRVPGHGSGSTGLCPDIRLATETWDFEASRSQCFSDTACSAGFLQRRSGDVGGLRFDHRLAGTGNHRNCYAGRPGS